MPTEVSTDKRFERLSTDRSDCRLSFAAPVGLLLSCNHIYNQYVFIDNSDETLQKFEKTARNMHSLSRYSRQNAINKEWIDEYLRGSLTRVAVCPCPFQCHGMGRGVGRVEASSQRRRQSVGKHGMCTTAQYGGLSDTFLGSDTWQRG